MKYYLTAGALGVGWFCVLLLPGLTREWLLSSSGQNLVCLVAASFIVAAVCRRFINCAVTLGDHLLRALVIPYLGCFVFLTLVAALLWLRTLLFGGLANLHDTISLYAMGMMAAVMYFFIIIPYGLFCQYVMSSISYSTHEGS